MNTQNSTTTNTVRRTVGACAAVVTALLGLAQPQIATAQTAISASIAPAQRFRAPDNGSSAVTIAAPDAAASGELAQRADAGDLKAADVKSADRVMQLKAADRVMQLKSADRVMQLKAADRVMQLKSADRVMQLKAADRVMQLKSADRVMQLKAADRVMQLKSADRVMQLKAADRVMIMQ